jgi:hypothetical protein
LLLSFDWRLFALHFRRSKLTLDDSGIILEKVAEYFYYNFKNRDREDVPDMEIPPELCLELLMAADYLDSQSCHRIISI